MSSDQEALSLHQVKAKAHDVRAFAASKAPFEPIKEASLKHFTFKTVFLLALGSGIHKSEIHAWQNKNIRHQSDWSKVSLYPAPSFLYKNQLAKEGPDSVAQCLYQSWPQLWISPPSLIGPFVWSEHCTTAWTGPDPRQNKELVFVSFKKGFDKNVSPATVSS